MNEGDERVQRNSEESEDVSRILTKTELSKLKQSLVSQKEDGKTSEWVSAAKFATWYVGCNHIDRSFVYRDFLFFLQVWFPLPVLGVATSAKSC